MAGDDSGGGGGERTGDGAGDGTTLGAWDPAQYDRFRDERSRPFYDLAAMIERVPGMRVIDLGCGTGELTAWLHGELGAAETLGVDSSPEMMVLAAPRAAAAAAADSAADGELRFERAEIVELCAEPARAGRYDLVFSNAALQWILDHETLIPRVAALVAPGGQLAVQLPANGDHVAYRLAYELAGEHPYATALDGWRREDPVLAPEWYAETLFALGFEPPRVRLEVYPHVLPDTLGVVEWMKGSLLTPYRARLPAALYERFVAEHERRVVAELGEHSPYFYPFRRILMHARRPA